jgi:hypothetical protein
MILISRQTSIRTYYMFHMGHKIQNEDIERSIKQTSLANISQHRN